MRTIRVVSSARARKLRRLGERVWWHVGFEALVWDMAESKRIRRHRVRAVYWEGTMPEPSFRYEIRTHVTDWRFRK